jgi:hypothetical protein
MTFPIGSGSKDGIGTSAVVDQYIYAIDWGGLTYSGKLSGISDATLAAYGTTIVMPSENNDVNSFLNYNVTGEDAGWVMIGGTKLAVPTPAQALITNVYTLGSSGRADGQTLSVYQGAQGLQTFFDLGPGGVGRHVSG